ncbi:quinolinate synthase NadA [[Eubacterium] cellulosolvens]
MPPGEEPIGEKILTLKEEKNAVLLVHNYQRPEIQNLADQMGDSLGLSIAATKTDADVIVFCGVDFMAESAKILNHGKIVLHPNQAAKCPMAAMVTPEDIRELKKAHPQAEAVAYVNTSAAVKAEVDVCCTSANAVKVVQSLAAPEIIFTPDVNLGLYVKRFIPDKEFYFSPGYCHVHQGIMKSELEHLKQEHPTAEVLVHPECIPEVIDFADHVFSTEGMVKHVKASAITEFILGTEKELCYRLEHEVPGKKFYRADTWLCPAMKQITIEDVLASIETLTPRVELSHDIIERAQKPLQRMIEII